MFAERLQNQIFANIFKTETLSAISYLTVQAMRAKTKSRLNLSLTAYFTWLPQQRQPLIGLRILLFFGIFVLAEEAKVFKKG